MATDPASVCALGFLQWLLKWDLKTETEVFLASR